MGKYVKVFCLWMLLACSDDLPAGLYGYQIERLLVGDSIKRWEQTSESILPDTLFFTSGNNDSLNVVWIEQDEDTIQNQAYISTFEILFTDSIIFSEGHYWIVREIRNSVFVFESYQNGESTQGVYSYNP